MIRGGQTYYYHADGLGSIIAITDSSGRVVQRYEYNSFGEITYQQNPNFKQPYTYTGREYDSESGLYYYRARYYDAKVGRFLQQDPFRGFLRNPQTQNRYPYVTNRPTVMIDPYGLVNSGQVGAGGAIALHGIFNVAVGAGLLFIAFEEASTVVGAGLAIHTTGLATAHIVGGVVEIWYGGKLIYKGLYEDIEQPDI